MMQISVWEFDQARALHRLLKKKSNCSTREAPFASRSRLSIDLIFMSDSCIFWALNWPELSIHSLCFQNMYVLFYYFKLVTQSSLRSILGNSEYLERTKGQSTMNSQSSFLFSFEFMSHPFRLKWPGVLKREESWSDGDHHVSPHLKWRIFPASFLDSILPLKSSSLVYWDDQKLNQQQRIELCSTSDEWTNGLERARVGVKAGWVPRRRYFVRLKLLFPFTFLMSSYLQLGKLEFILARPFPTLRINCLLGSLSRSSKVKKKQRMNPQLLLSPFVLR
mgnify:CR=1 FL=1